MTSLIRWLDFRLWSNRFIAIATVLSSGCMFAYALFSGDGFVDAGVRAAQAGAGVFLSWAIARELDPDNASSATLATILAAALLAIGTPSLSASLALLLAVRLLFRSTGKPPTVLDALFLIGLAVMCAATTAGIPAAAALAIALGLDARLPDPAPAAQGIFAVVVAAAGTGGALYFETLTPSWQPPTGVELAGLVLVTVGVLLLKVPAPTSVNDRKQPLNRSRLLAGTIVAVAAGAVTVALVGAAAVAALSPLWAALVAVALHRRLRKGQAAPDA